MADKDDRKIEDLLNKDGRLMRSPVFWFFLLAIPVVLSFYTSFWFDAPSEEKPPEVEAPVKTVVSPPKKQGFSPENFMEEEERAESPGPAFRSRTAALMAKQGMTPTVPAAGQQPLPSVPPCGFQEWVGKPADQQMQAGLKAQGHVFRILPPGSMMTMDHSPDRVNFETDAGGIVTRAWCG